MSKKILTLDNVPVINKKIGKIDTIEKLKASTIYSLGDVVEVLGFHAKGDGSHHKRIAKDEDDGSGELGQNGIWWCIVHSDEVNVSWFGAKGDGVTDESLILQRAFDYAFYSRVQCVFNKGEFITTKPLLVYGTHGALHDGGLKIRGFSKRDTIIRKTTNESINGWNACFIVVHNANGVLNWTKDSQHIRIKDIAIVNKLNNDCEYGIVSPGHYSYNEIEDVDIDGFTESQIELKGNCWMARFGYMSLYYGKNGLKMNGTGTSNHLYNIHAVGNSEYGMALTGVYSSAESIVVEYCKGTSYFFSYGNWNVSGMGEETTGSNSNKPTIKLNRATVTVGGLSIYGNKFGTAIDVYAKSSFVATSGVFGINSYENVDNLCSVGSDSYVSIGKGVEIRNTYLKDSVVDASSILDIKGEIHSGSYNGRIAIAQNSKFSLIYNRKNTYNDYNSNSGQELKSPPLGSILFEKNPSETNYFCGVLTSIANEENAIKTASFLRVPVVIANWTVNKPTSNLYDGLQFFDKDNGSLNIYDQRLGWKKFVPTTTTQQLDTPYYAYKMQQEGIYDDYVAYRDELHEYENSQTTDETMLLPVLHEPEIPESVKQFAEKYKLI